jgi:ABC-2 type transport system permease protein
MNQISQLSTPLALLPALSLWRREVTRFLRQRSRMIGALGTPIVFWVLIGSGLGRSFQPAAGKPSGQTAEAAVATHYLEYFFPGTLVLIVLFTAIFSMISIIEDRREGFLQAVLAAPVHRSAVVAGKTAGSATLALGQALLFLAFAPVAGISFSLTIASVIHVVFCLLILAIGLSALGFLIAWSMESTQGFHAIMNLFLIPMWMLSGALFPQSGASGWISAIMTVNPLTYGLAAVRLALSGRPTGPMPSYTASMLITLLFALGMVVLCTIVVTRRPNA